MASISWTDGTRVTFQGSVLRATYGPMSGPVADMTLAVRGLQDYQGSVDVHGGIHTRVGDPFPGVPKVFTVWLDGGVASWADGANVTFQGPIVRATYGPVGAPEHDVTGSVQQLQDASRSVNVGGGIHTRIGDPFPGVPKMFRVHFLRTLTVSFADGKKVHVRGTIIRATYSPMGAPEHDVTAAVRSLQDHHGRVHVEGGIHTRIGDPFPGVPKQLRLTLVGEAEYDDFESVNVQGHVARASYSPKHGGHEHDVTAAVRGLQDQFGNVSVEGGIHTRIGDPFPGQAKVLRVYAC